MSGKRKSKAKKWIGIGLVIVVVAGIAAMQWMKPKASVYEQVKAENGDIATIYSFSGNVETKNRQNVVADKMLQVSDIKVAEGDLVEEGDTLLTTSAGEKIKAKINGEVVSIAVEDQAQVMAGSPLMNIVDYDHLKVNVKVDEYDITSMKEGKEATVKLSALNKEVKGTIQSVAKEGEIVNGITFFMASIDLKKDKDIKIGMSAEVQLSGESAKGVVTLPMSTISFEDNNQPYVLKQGKDDKEIKTVIETGINDGTKVEVKKGIVAGDTILYKKVSSSGTGFPGRSGSMGPMRSGGSDK
jgi:HlyD family secretion protein